MYLKKVLSFASAGPSIRIFCKRVTKCPHVCRRPTSLLHHRSTAPAIRKCAGVTATYSNTGQSTSRILFSGNRLSSKQSLICRGPCFICPTNLANTDIFEPQTTFQSGTRSCALFADRREDKEELISERVHLLIIGPAPYPYLQGGLLTDSRVLFTVL